MAMHRIPITIRAAKAADVEKLQFALEQLSADLGDDHTARHHDLLKYGFGPRPSFSALLAEEGETVVGTALFSPLFSTTLGGSGAYVSDLWVVENRRGSGLGKRLLREAGNAAEVLWGASFLKLSVYHSNVDARSVYLNLGFELRDEEAAMILGPDQLKHLRQPE